MGSQSFYIEMNKIIKIRSGSSGTMKITWQMTMSCTYACAYCPPKFQQGKHPKIDLDSYANFFKKFEQPLVLSITGGECTTHPQFKDVLTMVRDLGIKIKVDSNNVRTARFYEEVGAMADVWCLTMHPSQHKFDIDKIRVLTDKSFVIVYVMMDPNHWDLACNWVEQLRQLANIKIILIKPVNNWAGADYNTVWTKERLDYLGTAPMWQFTKERYSELEQTHSWLKDTDTMAVWSNGTETVLDPDQLMKDDTHSFFNWQCSSGRENMIIDDQGNLSWGNCGIELLGHYSEFTLDKINPTVTCTRLRCDCGTDIRADKEIKNAS
jgi:organic radical activating enzyme